VESIDVPPTTEHPTAAARPAGTRIAFLLLAVGLAAVAAFLVWQGTQRSQGMARAGEVVTIAIDGMSCVGCAGAVTTRLEEIPGVAEVEVDYDHRLARIRLADQGVQPSTLILAVQDAGYGARLQR
jgi:copper chaperone CopZ